ncbi:MAG: glucosaminidase domain-containing protein [Gammaproteobacteria bacterium]|nr:glucosaminidase domain-containing protein [Gammaproteobacteria bacterium]
MISSSILTRFWRQLWAQNVTRGIKLSVVAIISTAIVVLVIATNNFSQDVDFPEQILTIQEPIVVFPDFASINSISARKQQFFDYLEVFVIAENIAITQFRDELDDYLKITNSGAGFSEFERAWVFRLARRYQIEVENYSENEIVDELLLRVDVLPVSLALAQAANESAWGTSRFALEGNNIFGQWCYEQGCGIVPARRQAGAIHEVRSFVSVEDAIESYFLNINSHPSYSYLRDLRSRMRARGLRLDSMSLAIGLGRYSERGDDYVDEVQKIIIQNGLRKRDV